ncbi:Isoleucine--tRNA ligase [Posidoniimonas polymericola]|uniref:Isoleucine--tRNA ligase n=1 Tax=Posidoniimonas polymericola TaxID=2528002 RepID=A0A5C5YPZ0_9BACT|nr:isoleucine--tRNA ligase [Posidoniimonas polymericola]TWT76899.1 Isoleucine--tRNA ligase [Posidoniimonas polymericola]
MFKPADGSPNFPQLEEDVLRFWKENNVYHKSLDRREGAEPFVFYEGPPTANGMPHPGHCLTRAIKDVFPRYKTMRGYRCERKAGWDTHGLPVEVEVCKELGIHSKEEIEAHGVEPFIQKCQASVWRYMQEWERLTERLGFWVDLDKAYVTYHQSYVESVWWSLKQLFDRDLLYQGHKIVWWWAQGGTALSAGEVGQGYRQVADPSVYVKFPLLEEGVPSKTSLIVWTTTPWTLPSNQFAAVHPEIEYAKVADAEEGGSYILAKDLVQPLAEKLKRELTVEETFPGADLVGLRYIPPFECYYTLAAAQRRQMLREQEGSQPDTTPFDLGGGQQGRLKSGGEAYTAWRVVPADFVTTDSGSGVVHQAPAFGEVDYEVLVAQQELFEPGQGPALINCVGPDGKFTAEAPEFVRGRWVKDCDKDITRKLKERGLLFHQEQYLHDYPFCWRADDDPLIQYPRESWFIKTTAFKDAMIANNQQINWLPEHIKGGRMGKFLESNVDWALSRERYWGTPLPIWQCEKTGKQEAIGGYEELLAKPGVAGTQAWEQAKAANPELPEDLKVHKPYIDEVTYDSPHAKGARMRRVTEVIDCWYDSGAMPFAQWGFKGEAEGEPRERFESQFPADFISEAIDQTRGWFYSQLAISTMLWGESPENPQSAIRDPQSYPHPFKNCIVLGLMLGEDGQKMSKSKRNYREPNQIFDKYGADALRWYLFANQPPWTSIRYSEQAIKDSIPEFLLRLWNCYSFFVIYANIDEFDPATELGGGAAPQPPSRSGGGTEGGGTAANQKTVATTGDALPSPNPSLQGRGIGQLAPSDFAAADSYRPLADRAELDRWIISELHRTAGLVTDRMDAYDNYGACDAITTFVDALSNWWVRRSRDRFWAKDKRSAEKLDAYWTLYECLVTSAKLIAPFTPFLAENFWQNLAGVFDGAALESVHLCDYPEADSKVVDEDLSERMDLVRLISSLGRRAREGAVLKVRQPLSTVEVILADNTHQAWLEEHAGVIQDELNVKAVAYSDAPEKYVDHEVMPNFKLLGKKLGKLMPKVKFALNQASGSELLANLRDNGKINLTVEGQEVELLPAEVEIRITAKEGWASANDRGVVVVLATELTDELIAEGLAQDLKRAIQDRRKEIGCEFTDRIEIGVETDAQPVRQAVEQHQEYLAGETLADKLLLQPLSGVEPVDIALGDHAAKLYVRRLA